MDWFRWHHDTTADPKWRLVARRSRQPLAVVVALWARILEHASECEERGTLAGWNDEVAAAALDLDSESVAAIRQAMQGLTLDGDELTGWNRRQPKREDRSTERVRAHRERVKRSETNGNAPEQSRVEQNREEQKRQDARAGEPDGVIRLHPNDSREDTISAIIRAANRGMVDNPELDPQTTNPILPGHGASRQAVADWLDAGAPADLAASVVYERAKEYRPTGSRKQIITMGYFTGAVTDAAEKRRAKEGKAPAAPSEPLTPEAEWRAANPAEYEAIEADARARLEKHESFARGSEGVRKTMVQDLVRATVRKRMSATLGLSA